MKVYEYAKENELESKEVSSALAKLVENGILPEETSTSASSNLDETELAALEEYFRVVDEEGRETEEVAGEDNSGTDEEREEIPVFRNYRVSLKGNPDRCYVTDDPGKAVNLYREDFGILSTDHEFGVEAIVGGEPVR